MEDQARAMMREALGVYQPDPAVRARVMASLPVRDRPRLAVAEFIWKPAASLIAIVVAGSLIVALILARNNTTLNGPPDTGLVGQGTIVTRVDFSCALPVEIVSDSTFIQVQLPGGLMVNRSDPPPADLYPVSSYDVQAGRWLPVAPSAISPDGRFWAYGTGVLGDTGRNGTIHAVDVITGRDTQLWSGSGGAQVAGIVGSTIYFEEIANTGPANVWAVDQSRPGSGRKVGAFPTGWVLSLAWFGPGGAFAVHADPNGRTEAVERMDLGTGSVTSWFTTAVGPYGMAILGLDTTGHPEVSVFGSPSERVLLLTGQNHSAQIADGSNVSFQPSSAHADSHGIWFGEPGSIWLYQPSTGLREVFALPPQGMFQAPPPKQVPGVTMPSPPAGTPKGASVEVIGPCR